MGNSFSIEYSSLGILKYYTLSRKSQESKLNFIMKNPGYSHIAQKILKFLDHQSQMHFRLVCFDWKGQVDQAYFWIQKCDKIGVSKEIHDAWMVLVKRIERGSLHEKDLVECLMKWYGFRQYWIRLINELSMDNSPVIQ